MGNFYTNFTVRGPSQQSVAAVLAGRSTVVSPTRDGCTVIFDEESDGQDQEVIAEFGRRLSGALHCHLLAALNHDDDIFWYQLYLNGELVDEYNSSPNYFDATNEAEAMAGPKGGDAKKICDAFGSGANANAEVEVILRKSSLDEEGYIFAFERHADLVAALGIPEFGVGAGFGNFSGGELPEDLSESDLLRTKDMIATEPPAQLLRAIESKAIPGYYKVSFRAHPQLKTSIPTSWMPNLWADTECSEQSLSDQFQKATASYRAVFKKLGFVEQGFKRLARVLNPNARDMGGISYLDPSRSHFGQIIYNRSYVPALQTEKEGVVVSFTAVFQNEILGCTNHQDFMEPVPNHHVIRLQSDDAGLIYEQFVQQLQQRKDLPRRFSDLLSLQNWFDTNTRQIFEYRVGRGTWVRMSEFEVEVARQKM